MNMTGSGIRIDRRNVLKVGATLGAGMFISSTTFAQQPKPARGGTLRLTMPYNPAALDPITGRNAPDFNSLYTMFDALIDFVPETLELKPSLAREWRFTDPLTLVLDLVEGVKFHDGTAFNAEAVKFNLERAKSDPRSNVKSDLAAMDSVEVSGEHQVTIRIKQPNAGLPAILTNRAGCMVSPTSIKAAADGNVDRAPVGTGPFKFVEWRDNDLIKVEKNSEYWQKDLPYLDAIELRIVNDFNAAARTVVGGEGDLALNLAGQQIQSARNNSDLIAESSSTLTFWTMAFNYAVAPLNDVRVRKALCYAINRDDINKVLMAGLGEPTSAIFPSSFWATDPETAHFYKQDIQKARALLAEAGYPDGIEIDGWGWPDQTSMQRTELIVSQMAEAGIKLKITPAPAAQAMQNFYHQKKGSVSINAGGGIPDPSLTYERLFASSGQFNAGGIELDGFRELLDASVATSDPKQRQETLHKLQRFMIENALHMPLLISAGMSVRNKKVQGFQMGLTIGPKFHKVWLSQA